MKWSQSIQWTKFVGGTTRITVGNCDSEEEAIAEAKKYARSLGWRPPRWWEFWRWFDTRLT